jgi:hypothetical protein
VLLGGCGALDAGCFAVWPLGTVIRQLNLEIKMKRRTFSTSVLASAVAAAFVAPTASARELRSDLFIKRAIEHPDNTVTLPLYRGTSNGDTVWFLIVDTGSGSDADRLGINRSDKLNNARGTAAVMKVRVVDGVIDFPASVDFAPNRVVVPGPTGFPPNAASPGAVGQTVNGIGYSPLIEMPDGTIRNAPHSANSTGQADRVRAIDTTAGTVRLSVADGFANGKAVKYITTDASAPDVAALEGVTYAPALGSAPRAGDDSGKSARAGLVAFVNGQTGASNPERQGLNSALMGQGDPLNVLRWTPNQGRYSPLWDVHAAQWTASTVAENLHTRQKDWGDIRNRVDQGFITGPGGARFGAIGVIVNCPVISEQN